MPKVIVYHCPQDDLYYVEHENNIFPCFHPMHKKFESSVFMAVAGKVPSVTGKVARGMILDFNSAWIVEGGGSLGRQLLTSCVL